MNREEFRQALRRNRITPDEFAHITGRNVKTIYDFGERSPVPAYARFTLSVIDEIGAERALFLAGLRKIRN